MNETPVHTSLLYDGPHTQGRKSRYSLLMILIPGIIGIASLIAAIVLTIVGSVGLRNYGFNNGPLIAGIVLFGVGIVFSITSCAAAGSNKKT
ncbi:hypothetical protein I4U23_016452 [Adineta vaga]|nr:hypothetical protein I4U23_016452 [Adineta vaga]